MNGPLSAPTGTTRVRAFAKAYHLEKARYRGCAVGMVDNAGAPIAKPWHIATDDTFLFEALSCPRPKPEEHLVHSTAQGRYTTPR